MNTPPPDSPPRQFWLPAWTLFLRHLVLWRCYRHQILLSFVCVSLLCGLAVWVDPGLFSLLAPEIRDGWPNAVARALSYWGDFLTFCLPVGVFLWTLGFCIRQRRCQGAGMACVLAACSAGLTTDLLQISIARPRPRHEMTEPYRPFHLDSECHSFPSGHATTAFASTTALTWVFPVAGIPLITAALAVGWSRIYLCAHYPSDVLMGAYIGILLGSLFGLAARQWSAERS